MAGRTGIMHLVVSRINRNSGCSTNDADSQMAGVAACRIRYPSQMAGVGMTVEIDSMAGRAVSPAVIAANAAVRHGASLTVGCFQGAISVVTGCAGIMNLIIGCTQRYTSRSSCRARVAGSRRAVGIRRYQGRMIATIGCTAMTIGSAGAIAGVCRIVVDSAGREGCYRVAGQTGRTAMQPGGIAQQRTAISSGPSGAARCCDMAVDTSTQVDIGHDIATRMAVIAGSGPDKIRDVMTTMPDGTICMTVKAAYRNPGHDNIVHRGETGSDIGRPGRVMALRAAEIMQGQDTICTGPGIGEQRIGGSSPAAFVAGITGRGSSQISRPLQNRMSRTGAMRMAVEIGNMAFRTSVGFRQSRIGSRAYQGRTANPSLMTKATITSMHPGHDCPLRCRRTTATSAMTALTGTCTCPGHDPVCIAVSGKDCRIGYPVAADIESLRITGRDIQGWNCGAVHNPGTKGSSAGAGATEGLVVGVIRCSQGRATTGISRRCSHNDIGAIPGRSLNLNIISPWREHCVCGLNREHRQGYGSSAPWIRHHQVRCRKVGGAILHRGCPISHRIARSTTTRSGAGRAEGRGEEVKASHRILYLTTRGIARCPSGAARQVGRADCRRLGMEHIDPYRLAAVMAAEANTPVIDLTHRIGNDMAAAVGGGSGKIRRIIGGGVSSPLIEGQDSHLVAGPTGRCLRRDMALFTRQMGGNAPRRRGLLEVSTACLVARIGMAELALTNQGVAIAGVMGTRHGRRMADGTEPATVIGCSASGRHRLDSTVSGPQFASLGNGIELMTRPTAVMHLAVSQADRRSADCSCGSSMAGYAGRSPTNHSSVVLCRMTGGRTVIGCGLRRVMMNTTGRESGNRVTGQTRCQTVQAGGITQQGATIGSGQSGAAAARIHMAHSTFRTMDLHHDIGS